MKESDKLRIEKYIREYLKTTLLYKTSTRIKKRPCRK